MKTQEQIFEANKRAAKKSAYKKLMLFNENGELMTKVKNAIYSADFSTNKIHHTRWMGSGRHFKLKSDRPFFVDLLSYVGCKFSEGNDAPRGGQNGDFIKCSNKAIALLKSLK